ncbi:MAG: hypothetical protein QOH12_1009 [Solirubrobacteraceae bacterium]|jgi:hypothetical protein|nr:hypothetical protein [Solirubrobacteraceae bacterium]
MTGPNGPPGTNKTLSVMYLLHAMPGRTRILLTGHGLSLIEQALAIGGDLAPATFVIEDIDLVAAERHDAVQQWPPVPHPIRAGPTRIQANDPTERLAR